MVWVYFNAETQRRRVLDRINMINRIKKGVSMKFGTKERFAGVLVMGCAMSLISALFVDASHFFKIALAMFALAPVFLVYAVDVLLLGRVIGVGVVFFWLCASLYIAYFTLVIAYFTLVGMCLLSSSKKTVNICLALLLLFHVLACLGGFVMFSLGKT